VKLSIDGLSSLSLGPIFAWQRQQVDTSRRPGDQSTNPTLLGAKRAISWKKDGTRHPNSHRRSRFGRVLRCTSPDAVLHQADGDCQEFALYLCLAGGKSWNGQRDDLEERACISALWRARYARALVHGLGIWSATRNLWRLELRRVDKASCSFAAGHSVNDATTHPPWASTRHHWRRGEKSGHSPCQSFPQTQRRGEPVAKCDDGSLQEELGWANGRRRVAT
jgi:hypothetical protein